MSIRAVIDTQIWIKIYLRLGVRLDPKQPYTDITASLHAGEVTPIYCAETIEELDYMLTRSVDVAQYFHLDPATSRAFVRDYVCALGEEVAISGAVHVSSDEDDDPFVEAAIIGHAECLVSDDQHLHEAKVTLELRKHGIRPTLWSPEFRKLLRDRRSA